MARLADAVVTGLGPAGATAALLLARAGWHVLGVDNATADDQRCEILTPWAVEQLDQLLGPGALTDAPACLGTRTQWGSGQMAAQDYWAAAFGHGRMIWRQALDRALKAALSAAGVTLLRDRVRALVTDDSGVGLRVLLTADAPPLRARHALLATGRAPLPVAPGPRRPVRQYGDRLIADRALLSAAAPGSAPMAYLHMAATPDGWIYAHATPDGGRMIGRLGDSRHALPPPPGDAAWAARTPLGLAPAQTYWTDGARGPGWCAIGDALWAGDPLAGDGIGRALAMGADAATAMLTPVDKGARDAACACFIRRQQSAHRAFEQARFGAYAVEGRWPQRPFWRARIRPRRFA
ncbi:hypothetical protein [Yunchengibacter salinarum]|uniref:hypothetical protein n=1 Tax=Yunchengibacter salinarum TaxID=3133399 RepID=UPI0035B687E6